MQRYFNNVIDRFGNAVAAAIVRVTDANGALASIFSDNGITAQANPITADDRGFFGFYAANGTYTLDISGTKIPHQSIPGVLLEDLSGSGGSASVGFIQLGSGAVARNVQSRLRERGSVFDFMSADMQADVLAGTRLSDHTAAIQAAASACANLDIPPGLYQISSPIAVPTNATWRGPTKKLYPNFTTDWQTAVPSWGELAATIQYMAGSHGALLSGADNATFDSIVFRCGQSRTSADCLFAASTAPSHVRMRDGLVQNLNHVVSQNTAAWGAWNVTGCQFIGCTSLFSGVVVDQIFQGNAVTSMSGNAFTLTSGSGLNLINGNRFEYGANAAILLQSNSRQNVISGNNFDAHGECAVLFSQCSAGNTVTGNIFWRNGTTASTLQSQCHIYIFNSALQAILGNTFIAGAPDAGGSTTPAYVVGLESVASGCNRFVGNQTRNGCTTSQVFSDRFSTSVRAIQADAIDLPAGQNPGTSSDDFYSAINSINQVCVPGVKVGVFENRFCTGFGLFTGVALDGMGASIALTNSSGAMGFGSINNISYGGLAYTTRNGAQYAPSQPDVSRSNGRWEAGRPVYNTTPAAGGKIGWVVTTAGSPDTWKAFGAVDA